MCWHCEKAKHIFFLTLEQSSFLLIIMFSCKDVQKIPKVFHLHMENWVGHIELGRCFMIEAHTLGNDESLFKFGFGIWPEVVS